MPSASTSLILRPTTSRSRSRRMTSTSGSSGIGPPLRGRVARDPDAGRVVVQAPPGDARRSLLSRLLRAALAFAVGLAADEHRGEEPLVVVRPLVAHLIARELFDPA